jgi:hypothetical protein
VPRRPESASELIERAEREAGVRIDANDGDNDAATILFGALTRALGQSKQEPRDDFAAGLLTRHNMSAAGQAQRKAKEDFARMVVSGADPDMLYELLKR